jgi:hypothetical protein
MQAAQALNDQLVIAEDRVRSRESPCTFLVNEVTLGDSLLLQLRFYSANYRFTSVPYLFLTLGMNDGHTEDTISAGHRRIPKILMRRNPPPSTTDIHFDDRI